MLQFDFVDWELGKLPSLSLVAVSWRHASSGVALIWMEYRTEKVIVIGQIVVICWKIPMVRDAVE